MFGRVKFLEAELARKDEIIERLLDRLMARDLTQFKAFTPDAFLDSPDPEEPSRLWDSTGLIDVDVPKE